MGSRTEESGLGRRSIKLQEQDLECGGPGSDVLIWKAHAVWATVENEVTTLYSGVTVGCGVGRLSGDRSPKWAQSDGSLG